MSEPVKPALPAARSAFDTIVLLLPRLTADQRRALVALLQKPDDVRPPPDISTLIG